MVERLENLIAKSVKSQTISDVPIGAFLSGGIDSSLVVALLQSQSIDRIKTFTIGFNEKEFNEANKAKAISNVLNTDHTEVYFSSNDALNLIPNLPKIFSEPFADPSMLPTILISEIARKNVTVALSGDGGDEIFGGYNRYKLLSKIRSIDNVVPSLLKKTILKSYNLFSDNFWDSFGKKLNINQGSDKMRKIMTIFSANNDIDSFKKIILNYQNPKLLLSNYPSTDLIHENIESLKKDIGIKQIMMSTDQKNYLTDDILVKLDRSSMASSLETRVPFLDRNLVEFAADIPINLKVDKKVNKIILRKILKKYLPKNVIDKKKSGFSAPIDQWLRGPLREWSEDLIHSNDFKKNRFFKHENIISLWKLHLSKEKNVYRPLWSILIFLSWLKYYS